MKIVKLGGQFSFYNPVMAIMKDKRSGELKDEVLNEKVLSAIGEFIVTREKALDVLEELVAFINQELESVATISIIARNEVDGSHAFLRTLKERCKAHGYSPYPNGKVNIGIAGLKEGYSP